MTSAGIEDCLPCDVCNMVDVCLNFWPTLGMADGDTLGTVQGQLPASRAWTNLLRVQEGLSCIPLFAGWRATSYSLGTLDKSPKHLYHLLPFPGGDKLFLMRKSYDGHYDAKNIFKATSPSPSPKGISQPALPPEAQGNTLEMFNLLVFQPGSLVVFPVWIYMSDFPSVCLSFPICKMGYNSIGTSLAVQWLGLHTSTAGSMDSVPGWRTKILQAVRCGQKKSINLRASLNELIYVKRLEKLPAA